MSLTLGGNNNPGEESNAAFVSPGFLITKDKFEMVPGQHGFNDFAVKVWSPNGAQNTAKINGLSLKIHAQPAPLQLRNIGGKEGARFGAYGDDYFQKENFQYGTRPDRQTGMKGEGVRYTPSSPYRIGDSGDSLSSGDSFAEIGVNDGIGLYSFSGPVSPGGPLAFMQPKRYSSNPTDCGMYVGAPTTKGNMRPFNSDMKTMVVKTRQEVVIADFPGNSRGLQKGGALVLENTFDPRQFGDPDLKISRIAYSPNVFNSREGSRSPHVLFDPDQSGQPFVGGGFLGRGKASILRGGIRRSDLDVECWTTYGRPTQHEPFSMTNFTLTVTWEQFKATLLFIALKVGHPVSTIFGDGWENPKNWRLKSVKCAGQEIQNSEWQWQTARMGGRVKWMTVQAI
tara:strand:- start:3705 stop:4895 length:1191 start_codon:yes stop_codon:yes gene_type:complete